MSDSIKEKLKKRIEAQLICWAPGDYFSGDELQALLAIVEESELPVDSSERGGYRVTSNRPGRTSDTHPYIALGPGIDSHPYDVPSFALEVDAEAFARCCSRAYSAGESARSRAISGLLGIR